MHRLLGLLLLLGPGFWFTSAVGALDEIYNPSIGRAILAEAGWSYILQAHLANLLVLLAYLGGVASRRRWPMFLPGPATGVTVAIASGAAITAWCVDLTFTYAGQIGSSCGTTAARVYAVLVGPVPILLAVPFAGWLAAWKAGFAVSAARCVALSTLAVWITVLAFIRWG